MADFDDLLIRTSRTFGLAIPLLSDPFRHELTLAYLLFRVADTLEDAEGWPRAARVAALCELGELLRGPDPLRCRAASAAWVRQRPSQHAGYLDLLAAFPDLMLAVEQLPSEPRDIVVLHTCRTVEGMASFVRRSDEDGSLQLETLDDLRDYCYAVAGIVGDMITELLLARTVELQPVAAELRERGPSFGEALQLVNILKDAHDDARQGRVYLPPQVSRERVLTLALEDLGQADQYVEALRRCGAGHSLIAFTEFPIRLARGTLQRIRQFGSGAKLTRHEVAQILQQVGARRRHT